MKQTLVIVVVTIAVLSQVGVARKLNCFPNCVPPPAPVKIINGVNYTFELTGTAAANGKLVSSQCYNTLGCSSGCTVDVALSKCKLVSNKLTVTERRKCFSVNKDFVLETMSCDINAAQVALTNKAFVDGLLDPASCVIIDPETNYMELEVVCTCKGGISGSGFIFGP